MQQGLQAWQGVLCVLLSTLVLSACTWQDTLHQAGRSGEVLRIQPAYLVDNPPRWRLAPDANLAIHAAPAAPKRWTQAAAQGLGRIFTVHDDAAFDDASAFVLEVHWPSQDAPSALAATTNGVSVGMLGFLEVPRLPPSGRLELSLRDALGAHVHRFALVVHPRFWDEGWQESRHIEAAFNEVAETLRGG